MSEYKNQHFIPKYYFRWFSDHPKQIDLFNIGSRRFIPNVSIKSQASKNGFYGAKTAEKLVTELENHLRGSIRAVREWGLGDYFLDPSNHLELLQAVLFQRSRTQAERTKSADANDKMIKEYFKATTRPDDPKYKLIRDHLDDIKVGFNGQTVVQIETSLLNAMACADMGIAVLQFAPDDDRILVFGDSPVVFYNHLMFNMKVRGVLGFQNPGLLSFFPLSTTQCLVFFDPQYYDLPYDKTGHVVVLPGLDSDLDEVNKLQMLASYTGFYYRGNQYIKYLKRLWASVEEHYKPVEAQFNKAPGFYHGAKESFGEVMHMYEPQVDYLANLSFVYSPPLEDPSKSKLLYRSPELIQAIKLCNNGGQLNWVDSVEFV